MIQLRMLTAAMLWLCAAASYAGTVTVITSFPKELTSAYKAAFEKANPGITIEIATRRAKHGTRRVFNQLAVRDRFYRR